MVVPTGAQERSLRRKGFRQLAGVDEAGRGAWAGPLVCAAVILPQRFRHPLLRDSKMLSAAQRELVYEAVVKGAHAWSVVIVPSKTVDTQGVHRANLQGLADAVAKLSITPDYVLADAWQLSLPQPSHGVVHGDQLVKCIAAASIVAKVTRDRLMVEQEQSWPGYAFARHKGYGTPQHQSALATLGPSPIHRFSFAPIQLYGHALR